MPHSHRQCQLGTGRHAKYGCLFTRQSDAEARLRPTSYVLDEEVFVSVKPFRVEVRRVLVESEPFILRTMDADHHDHRFLGFEVGAPRRNLLAVTGEDNRLWRA